MESADETLKCDYSNESYWAVLFCGTVIILYKVVPTFDFVNQLLNKYDHSLKAIEQYFSVHDGYNFLYCGLNPNM